MSKSVLTLAQKIANPGTRSSVPTSKLPPALAAERQRLARNKTLDSTLYNPAAVLAGPDLHNTVNALADMQARPQLDALDQQAAQAKANNQMVADRAKAYYAQLAGDAGNMAQQSQGIADQRAATQQHIDQGESDALKGIQTNALAGANEDARTRGDLAHVGTDQLISRLAQSQADLAQRSAADQTANNSVGATNQQYALGRESTAGLAGGELQGALGNKLLSDLTGIGAKRSDVLGQEGANRADLTQKLRQQGFDNIITQLGLNLKGDQLQASVDQATAKIHETSKHNSAMEKVASGRNDIAQQQANTAAGGLTERQRHDLAAEGIAQQRADTAGHDKSGKTNYLAAGQQNAIAGRVRTIAGWLITPPPDKNGKPQTPQQVIANLRNGKNPLGKPVDPLEVALAQRLASNHLQGIGQSGAHLAHRLGVTVGGHFTMLQPTPTVSLGGITT